MARRKIRDEAEAVAVIEEARRRGVKPSVVSREHGIDGRSVQAWGMALAKRRSPAPSEGLLELVPVVATSARHSYRVWVGDLSIEVCDDFDEHSVRRLVTVLRAC